MFKHGKSRTRIYHIWRTMIRRCSDPKAYAYKRYGGRGIAVCKEWMSLTVFEEWALSHGYSQNLTIDRKNNDLGYCPENCRWATCKEQAFNRRNNKPIVVDGKMVPLNELAKSVNLGAETLRARLKRGLSLQAALKPVASNYRSLNSPFKHGHKLSTKPKRYEYT